MEETRRVVIVGGIAGGASCAARLRRLDERARIIMIERGPYVSFANCGLPYYVGDVIREQEDLLVATPELFRSYYNIEVRVRQEVIGIERENKSVIVRDLSSGETYREPYSALLLAPGASPVRPPWPGARLPGIFTVRTIPDSSDLREWIESRKPRKAVIVGGSYIGLEMAENLARRGLAVTVVDILPQVMPAMDPEMAEPIVRHLETHRVAVRLGEAVVGFEEMQNQGIRVLMAGGGSLPADLVVLSVGVRPETELARAAGLVIGELGGIRVDDSMRTSDAAIWAVGDAVEARHSITGRPCLLPLAGPANRQGRVAAESICGHSARFRGVQGTAVCGIFGLTAAITGANEKMLKSVGILDYEAVYLHPNHHASYYPNAKRIHFKLLFSRPAGRILGAQAVGEEGVEKRIDVVSIAMQLGGTVFDLEECELSYAPQYGSAKDPVNLAGMTAGNVLNDRMPLAPWAELGHTAALLLDVRETSEFAADSIEGARNIPLGELRGRLDELPRDREIWVSCAIGQRGYYAVRILLQNGFLARNLSGGYLTYCGFNP